MAEEAEAGDKGNPITEDRPAGQQEGQALDVGRAGDGLPPGVISPGSGEPEAAASPEGEGPKPEEYDLEMPEGFQLDQAGLDAFKEASAKHRLSKEGAREFFAMFHKRLADSNRQANEHLQRRIAELYEADRKTCLADPEVGGEKFKASQEAVARALRQFAVDRDERGEYLFAKEMKERGMANSPQLFKLLARAGAFLAEAGAVASDAGAPAGRRPEEILYKEYRK